MPRTESIQEFIERQRTLLKTPYYLIDEERLLGNLQKVAELRERCGAKSVLALKCFSTWALFDRLRDFLDGTTSSSLYEARLGYEKFGKEVHAYSVAFSEEEMREVRSYASKIIFNSVPQFERFYPLVKDTSLGLRVNPGISFSEYDLADPSRRYSRLGVADPVEIEAVSSRLSGLMFHCNCENGSFDRLTEILNHISDRFGSLLHRMQWVSLGGGIAFTNETYAFDAFCRTLADFASRFQLQVYLEPGDTVVSRTGYLVTQVLDIIHNELDVAIVDAGVEPHMPDLLIYRMTAKMDGPSGGRHRYMLAGRTCLAGDIFGTYSFPEKLQVGSLIAFADAAAYTMVKKNWFNGITMPSIVVRRVDGQVEVIRAFSYEDFLSSLS